MLESLHQCFPVQSCPKYFLFQFLEQFCKIGCSVERVISWSDRVHPLQKQIEHSKTTNWLSATFSVQLQVFESLNIHNSDNVSPGLHGWGTTVWQSFVCPNRDIFLTRSIMITSVLCQLDNQCWTLHSGEHGGLNIGAHAFHEESRSILCVCKKNESMVSKSFASM